MAEPGSAIAQRLASRLRQTRKDKGLSLDALAKLSGVSRSMLSQIERAESSPTVASLWNLTQALGVDFAGLLDGGDEPAAIQDVLRADATPVISSLGRGCRIRILSPAAEVGQVEIYELLLDPEGRLESAAHRDGCVERLSVLDGALTVRSGDAAIALAPGDTAQYRADLPHEIVAEAAPARAILVVKGA